MSYTKRQFVTDAFEGAGLASYVFDINSDQLQSAARILDRMIATWNGRGVRLSYPLPSSPESTDLDSETNVPDSANEAIVLNLAVRLGPGYGKTASPDLKKDAKSAYLELLSRHTKPREMQLTALPSGAGNMLGQINQDSFLDEPSDDLLIGGKVLGSE